MLNARDCFVRNCSAPLHNSFLAMTLTQPVSYLMLNKSRFALPRCTHRDAECFEIRAFAYELCHASEFILLFFRKLARFIRVHCRIPFLSDLLAFFVNSFTLAFQCFDDGIQFTHRSLFFSRQWLRTPIRVPLIFSCASMTVMSKPGGTLFCAEMGKP